MAFSPAVVSLSLMVYFLLFVSGSGALHGHKQHHRRQARHRDKVIGRATTSPLLSLAASSVTPSDYTSFLQASATPCTESVCATAVPSSSVCPLNGDSPWNEFAATQNYSIICDIDFPEQNIYPFVLASSFEDCLAQCESYNAQKADDAVRCEGFVFAPERVKHRDDCYLKSSLNDSFPATISLIGATRVPSLVSAATPIGGYQSTTLSFVVSSRPTPLSSDSPIAPNVLRSQLHGASVNKPTTQWVSHQPVSPMKLAETLLKPGINCDLITDFDLADDTGPLTSNSSRIAENLADLSVIPHISRDGGKGGQLDGKHLFIFCDTASFTTTTDTEKGQMVGFTSSSVAIDDGWNGISGRPLTLVDGIGQWNDDVGRMRGFSPMTYGEESFNIALSGNGYRYAVWPESSIIPLNKTHGLQYASLVYDEVDMSTQQAKFTTIGNTLLTLWVDEKYGPTAERTVKHLFRQGEVTWGSLGGIRSWGSQGMGGNDGRVYLFGGTPQGILVARADVAKVADRDSYEYWTGSTWSPGQLPQNTTATPTAAYILSQPVMDLDIFYAPHYRTYIMVYLTPNADNTFYYRHLQSPLDSSSSSSSSTDADPLDRILCSACWSDAKILYRAATPPAGSYIYAGSVHMGYFGNEDDITKGGRKLLLSWTEHTGEDAASVKSGYAHMTARVEFE